MKFALLILGWVLSLPVSAGIYKCTDAKGNTIYRAIPCADGQSNVELNVKTGSGTDLNAKEQEQLLTQQEQEAKDAQKKLAEEQEAQRLAQFKQNAIEESAKNQFLVKNNPDKFSAYAIPPYKYEDLPPFVKTFQNKLPDIERFRRIAAEKSLASGQCGRVESVELSEKSTKDALVILVDCSSAKKFYLSEKELAN